MMKFVEGQLVRVRVWGLALGKTRDLWAEFVADSKDYIRAKFSNPFVNGEVTEWWVGKAEETVKGFSESGYILRQPQLGDSAIAKVWWGLRSDGEESIHSQIIKIGHDRLWIDIPKGHVRRSLDRWEIRYLEDDWLCDSMHGVLLSYGAMAKPALVKKTWSPLMNDPYGKGPEGETGGPSGLIFL